MPAGGYEEGRLFAFEQSRIQYRMVLLAGPKPNDGLYVANLQSAASDPICTFLDPPLHLRAELRCDSDVVPAVVTLSWRLPNMEWLRLVGTEGSGFDNLRTSSWAAGLMPSKVQVRWRVLQSLPSNDEALFPAELASGSYVTSPPTAMEADFRMDETWQCTYKEALPAAIAVFGVRLGTLYKWSPWSEDSPALSVEVPEPCPRLSAEASGAEAKDSDPYVEISDLTDSEAQALWRPFATEGALRALEYRVSICQLEGPESAVLWEDAVVAGILHVQEPPEKVGFPLRGLRPDQWYQVRVDARYPCVGKRAFSDSKAVSAAFRTPLPVRPPRQPLPLRLDLDEEEPQPAQAEEAEAAEASATAFLWAARPWVSVHVEHFASETYKFQFKEAVLHGGRSDFEGWQEPVVVEAALQPPQRPGPSLRDQESAIVRIGFPKGAPELVALRLADTSSGASPLRWSVTSPPLVTRVAPPLLARCFEGGGALQLLPTDGGGLQLCLRFFLQPRDEEAASVTLLLSDRFSSPPSLLRLFAASREVSRKALPGHRHVSQCQLRLRVKGESKAQI
ncbi:unnamed protein product [Symbiodinium sp. CCMP2592]|nr:unnamed protein product [Symbiodinium sp. CCMP2592]